MKRYISLFLMSLLILGLVPVSSHAADSLIVKIGLNFGSDAVPAAKLENADSASGFSLGFYADADRSFRSILETTEKQITVMKNKTMYINSSNQYYDTKPSSYKYYIGCYHLQGTTKYTTLAKAQAQVTKAKNLGLNAFVAFIHYGYYVRIGEFLTADSAKDAISSVENATGLDLTVANPSNTCYTVAITGSDRILFQLDLGGTGLGVWPKGTQTKYDGWRYYGGLEFKRINGNDMTVISVINMDQYVKGVIPYELSASWPEAALQAQALCAKSYAYNNMNKHKSQGFDLCNTTDCQVYHGTNSATAKTDALCDALSGLYVLYNGKVANTYYHSHSGGWTDDCINIWGQDVPYLKAVEDKWLTRVNNYSFSTTNDTLTTILKSKGNNLSADVVDFYVGKYSPYGNAMTMCFTLADGTTLTFSGDKARTAINSSSNGVYIGSHRYTIVTRIGIHVNGLLRQGKTDGFYAIGGDGKTATLDAVPKNIKVMTASGLQTLDSTNVGYDVAGSGYGHNLGMSQWGAHGMANAGFKYDEIIKYYFTGVTIGRIK